MLLVNLGGSYDSWALYLSRYTSLIFNPQGEVIQGGRYKFWDYIVADLYKRANLTP